LPERKRPSPIRAAADGANILLGGVRGRIHPADAVAEVFPSLRFVRRPASVRHDPDGPIAVLSPHLDDAALGCWEVLSGPKPVEVINFFTRPPPKGRALSTWDRVTGGVDPATHMQQRVREDREALAVAGRQAVNLGLFDSQYRRVAPSLAQMRVAVGKRTPHASCVYAPAGIGGHADHALVRRLALDLMDDGVPVCLYAELPYAVRFGWPHWVTGTRPDPHRVVDAWWDAGLAGVRVPKRRLEVRVAVLDRETVASKLSAIQLYRTQFPALSAGARSGLVEVEVLRYEVYWDVVAC
jgi:LmbE family N-acetylglucosaminyl deacetylase